MIDGLSQWMSDGNKNAEFINLHNECSSKYRMTLYPRKVISEASSKYGLDILLYNCTDLFNI